MHAAAQDMDWLQPLAEHKNSDLLNVNYADETGKTALMWAVQGTWKGLLYFLINFPNVDIHHRDKAGDTALSLAIDQERNTAIKLLSSINSPLAATRCLEEAIQIMPFLIDNMENPDHRLRPPLIDILKNISFMEFKELLQQYGAKIDKCQEVSEEEKPNSADSIDQAIKRKKIYEEQNLRFSLCTRNDYITLFSKNKLNLPKECAALIVEYVDPHKLN